VKCRWIDNIYRQLCAPADPHELYRGGGDQVGACERPSQINTYIENERKSIYGAVRKLERQSRGLVNGNGALGRRKRTIWCREVPRVGAHGTIRSTRGFREALRVGMRGTTEVTAGAEKCRSSAPLVPNWH
jgi:hypothetical protein